MTPTSRLVADSGVVRHSCKKLQSLWEECLEIINFTVFVHLISPTGFFVYDFGYFYRLKTVH